MHDRSQSRQKTQFRFLAQETGFDVVVVAASAGGVGALASFLSVLPKNFGAPVVVVQHLPPSSRHISRLDRVLQKSTALHVKWAEHSDPLVPGFVYIAPQDRSTVLDKASGCLVVSKASGYGVAGPVADPLFRSAAVAFGNRVIAVVLSGVLCDGAEGAAAIALVGGRILAQAPSDAAFPDMPRAAMVRSHVGLPLNAHSLAHVTTSLVMVPGAAAWFPIGKAGVCANLIL